MLLLQHRLLACHIFSLPFGASSAFKLTKIDLLLLVYTTNTNFVDDEAGARLENFFWRIWSSSRIYETIQGPALARLFARISDGSQSIRTTPVHSPPKPPPSRKKVQMTLPFPLLPSYFLSILIRIGCGAGHTVGPSRRFSFESNLALAATGPYG